MRLLGLTITAVVVAGCGGGGESGGGTNPPPAVASVAINPSVAQSKPACGTVSFTATPMDAQGNALSRAINWSSSDPAKVSLSAGSGTSTVATGIGIGSATITATSETKPSSAVTVSVTPATATSTADVTATTSDTFTPGCVVVSAGGTVTWTFQSVTHNVRFDAAKPTGGDIAERTNTTESRTFANAGSYPYTCSLHANMHGTVVVQ